MKFRSVSNSDELSVLRTKHGENKLCVIAIDLGFSGKKETTRYACSEDCPNGVNLTFAHAIARVINQRESTKEIALILEAPLSGRFQDGNPVARGDFEKGKKGQRPKNWNIGAGAAMTLAALYFLHQLNYKLQGKEGTIHLMEGFVSGANKPKGKKKQPQHAKDARLLLATYLTDDSCFIPIEDDPSSDVLVTINVLGIGGKQEPPIVLNPKSRK